MPKKRAGRSCLSKWPWRIVVLACIEIIYVLSHLEVLAESEIKPVIAEFSKVYNKTVDKDTEFVFQYRSNITKSFSGGIRVKATCDDAADLSNPISFVVKDRYGVLSWNLPMESKSGRTKTLYRGTGRTLCSDYSDALLQEIYVTVSTFSAKGLNFTLSVDLEPTFILQAGKTYTSLITLDYPRFYKYEFPDVTTNNYLLEVTSPDDYCATVSIQNYSCPVRDQLNNVLYEGYWQTITRQGGMPVSKENFPLGFYVVFVMHPNDDRCTEPYSDRMDYEGEVNQLSLEKRKKAFSFVLQEQITFQEYIRAIFTTIGVFLLYYILSAVVSCAFMFKGPSTSPEIGENFDSANFHNSGILTDDTHFVVRSQAHPIEYGEHSYGHISGTHVGSQHRNEDSDYSLDEEDIDKLEDADKDKDVIRSSTVLHVAALARKNPKKLAKETQLYLWTLVTVAIFYGLPVVQFVVMYQKVLHLTGDQDMCYYNYLCSHPLWILSDFNHVFSNIGYIMLGFLFLLLVLRREKMHERLVSSDIEKKFGIPKHFGMLYAMGLALIMEGVLSACYHVCPNHLNFQFDTCFMYVNSMLCMLKIYQTRHPDINSSSYMAFSTTAFFVLIGTVGILDGSFTFWILFTLLHSLGCLYLSVQVYYLGRWKLDSRVFKRLYSNWKAEYISNRLYCFKPLYIDRMVLLVIANLVNFAIAGYGMYEMPRNFASHLLLICISNLSLYTLFYIVMKIRHRERITYPPIIYIFLAVFCWATSFYMFLQPATSWELSPAESRTYNKECLLMRFYDTHDIWHFLSASGMFFSFMILLTLDDDLESTPRTQILVF